MEIKMFQKWLFHVWTKIAAKKKRHGAMEHTFQVNTSNELIMICRLIAENSFQQSFFFKNSTRMST